MFLQPFIQYWGATILMVGFGGAAFVLSFLWTYAVMKSNIAGDVFLGLIFSLVYSVICGAVAMIVFWALFANLPIISMIGHRDLAHEVYWILITCISEVAMFCTFAGIIAVAEIQLQNLDHSFHLIGSMLSDVFALMPAIIAACVLGWIGAVAVKTVDALVLDILVALCLAAFLWYVDVHV